jgi:hypothetical protein
MSGLATDPEFIPCPVWVKKADSGLLTADIGVEISDVRFTPESGHAQRGHRCLLSAIIGHPDTLKLAWSAALTLQV